jgi:formamidopyrimidine-DNA glycosylase
MPELPEVETVVRGLRAVLPGRCIVGVRLGKTDFIKDPAALEQHLPGRRISGVRRYGKFLVIDLDSLNRHTHKLSLLIHLGMTGQLRTCPPDAPIAPHTHVFFSLDDGRELRYTDIRRFGNMQVLEDDARDTVLSELGLDPLEATADEFGKKLQGRKARIKALLLDQHVLRGMGNIYTDESLWHARIHPMRIGAKLKTAEIRRLYQAMRKVLLEAIRLRGSSVSDYVDCEGQPGEFQLRHRVYQRQGKQCFRCAATIRRVIVAGRSSHFCPRCQLAPRSSRLRDRYPAR